MTSLPPPTRCPVLGIRLRKTPNKGKPAASSASIDRIDSRKGYVPGNVRVLSHRANMLKTNAQPLETLRLAVDAARILLQRLDAKAVA